MTDAIRTPHGCPVCGRGPLLALVDPAGLALCAQCGALLRWLCDYVGRTTGVGPDAVTLQTRVVELGLDSLDLVEVIVDLEEHFGLYVPAARPGTIETVLDWLRWIQAAQDEPDEAN